MIHPTPPILADHEPDAPVRFAFTHPAGSNGMEVFRCHPQTVSMAAVPGHPG